MKRNFSDIDIDIDNYNDNDNYDKDNDNDEKENSCNDTVSSTEAYFGRTVLQFDGDKFKMYHDSDAESESSELPLQPPINLSIIAHGSIVSEGIDRLLDFYLEDLNVFTWSAPMNTSSANANTVRKITKALHEHNEEINSFGKLVEVVIREERAISGHSFCDPAWDAFLKKYRPEQDPKKNCNIQHDRIYEKRLIFLDKKTPDDLRAPEIWGVWDIATNRNILADLVTSDETIDYKSKKYLLSDLMRSVRELYPGREINVFDISCSNVKGTKDVRLARRFQRQTQSVKHKKTNKSSNKRKLGGCRKTRQTMRRQREQKKQRKQRRTLKHVRNKRRIL